MPGKDTVAADEECHEVEADKNAGRIHSSVCQYRVVHYQVPVLASQYLPQQLCRLRHVCRLNMLRQFMRK